MKKFAFLLALIASFAVLTPSTSQARDYHHGSSRRVAYYCKYCHQPVYQERRISGYGRHHRAIYVWRTIPHYHRHGHSHHHR